MLFQNVRSPQNNPAPHVHLRLLGTPGQVWYSQVHDLQIAVFAIQNYHRPFENVRIDRALGLNFVLKF